MVFFFGVFKDEKYYLRSLGEDPRKDVADIRQQFPSLGGDITFPMFFREEQFFSSVFRISSPGLQLWTHYDVRYKIRTVKLQESVALAGLMFVV